MARAITMATGKVAFTASFPVDVLIKSEPAGEFRLGYGRTASARRFLV